MSVRKFLSGKKSYLVAIAGVATAASSYADGASLIDTAQLVVTSLGIGTLRLGLAKAVVKGLF